MRDLFALFSPPWLRPLAWLGCILPAMAGAQQPEAPAPAASPQAATSALAHVPMPAHPLRADEAPTDWRAAHQAVGAFPRGHADIVRWEAGQGSAAPAPAGHGHHHGGHKP